MKTYLSALLCFSLCVGHSQEPYAEFDLESNIVREIQAFEVGDSTFLSYTDKGIRKAFWIDGDGKTSELYLNHPPDIRICGIQKQSDTTFLYYLKEQDHVLGLHVLKQPSQGGNVYSGGEQVTLPGGVMALYGGDEKLIVVCFVKKSNTTEIISINRGAKIGGVELQMEDDFRFFATSPGFITSGGLTAIPQGSAPTKIYKDGDSLVITIDQEYVLGRDMTKVIIVNLSTAEHVRFTIPAPDNVKFASFYHDKKLFRFLPSYHLYEWFVYDIETGKTLYTKRLKQEKSLRERSVVFRSAQSQVVGYGQLHDMMRQPAEPSIIVEKIPGRRDLRIVTGTFENSKGVATTSGLTPADVLAGLIVGSAINQLKGPARAEQYFYIKGNLEKGFHFEALENISAPSVRQIIDSYEISRTSGGSGNEEQWNSFLLYKGYLELNDGALGIYHERRRNERKLILLKYKNSDTPPN